MVTTALQSAVAKAEQLPKAAQDKLGRDLIERIEKLQALRAEIEPGIRSLERGEGRELDIEDVIRQSRATHAAQ